MSVIKNQLVKNSASTILQIIAALISGLILPPILIAKLGFKLYGIWGLIVLLNQYVMILDLGLQSGLIKLTSEFITKGEKEKVNKLFSANIFIYLSVTIFISAILILVKDPFMKLFFGESVKYQNLYEIALIYSITALLNLLTLPYSSLLKGLQRYDISNFIEIICLIINAIVSIVFILLNFGLFGLVYGFIFSSIIKFVLLIIRSKNILPDLSLSLNSFNMFKDLKALLFYAPADLSVKIFSAISQTLIRFSLKFYAGIEFVGIYDIAKRLVNQISGFSSSIFIPFLPAMSSLSAENKREEIAGILKKSALFLNLFSLPVLIYLLLFFEPILSLWLHISDVSDIKFAASILLIATFLDLFSGPVTISSIGFGVIRVQVIKLTLSFIILSTLVIILGYYFHFNGIIISELVTNFIAMIFSILFFDKLFGYNYTTYFLRSFINIAKITLPVIFFFYILWVLFIKPINNYFIIFGLTSLILSAIIIIKVLLKLNILSNSEINLIKNIFIKKRADF